MSGLDIAFFGGLFGALLGGLVSAWINRRRIKLQTTLSLLTEWNSAEMQRNRLVAFKALDERGSIIEAFKCTDDPEVERAITAMVHFWEKAAILDEYGETKPLLFKAFFADMARTWIPMLFGTIEDFESLEGWEHHARPILKLAKKL